MATDSCAISREDYDHIPLYDGNLVKLNKLIKAVEAVFRYTCKEKNTAQKLNHLKLLNKVKAKLEGIAEAAILSREVDSIHELLDHQRLQFSDPRTIESLKIETYQMKIGIQNHRLKFSEKWRLIEM